MIYDTGASYGLTPFHADFIDYEPCDIGVKDVTKMNKVVGIGTVLYKMKATNGDILFLPGLAYHLKTADIRLFSPQTYHQLYHGRSSLDGDHVVMHLKKPPEGLRSHSVKMPIDK